MSPSHAAVAQLAEAAGSKLVGWGFESLQRYRLASIRSWISPTTSVSLSVMSRSGPRPRLRSCPTCGGYFPYKRGTKGGRLYITPPATVIRRGTGSFRYMSFGRPGPSTRSIRAYYPSSGGTWFRCPNAWHEHWLHGNPKQEHSRRTSPARPSTERPGRAAVEARSRTRALNHKARQGKARR